MQTPSQKGLTGPTATVLNDISSIVRSLLTVAASTSLPLFLMGHSMGGAEVIQWAARGPLDMRSQIRGYVIESPYLALHKSAQPSRLIVTAGRLAAKAMPKRQMYVFLTLTFPPLYPIFCLERCLPGLYSSDKF